MEFAKEDGSFGALRLLRMTEGWGRLVLLTVILSERSESKNPCLFGNSGGVSRAPPPTMKTAREIPGLGSYAINLAAAVVKRE